MQISKPATDIIIKISLAIAVIIILVLIYTLFRKELIYEVYRAKIETKQEAFKDLQAANKIIDAQRKTLDSTIARNTAAKATIVNEYNTFQTTKPNTQKYNEQINNADTHNSEQLKQFFTNL